MNKNDSWYVMAKNNEGYSYTIYTSNLIDDANRCKIDIFNSLKEPNQIYVDTHTKGYHSDLETFDIIDLRTKEIYVKPNLEETTG